VGSDEKAELARAHGCEHPIVYTREKFVDRVKGDTSGRGVKVAYDSVGKDTLLGSVECLQTFGRWRCSVNPRVRCALRSEPARPRLQLHHAALRLPLRGGAPRPARRRPRALRRGALGAVKIEVRQTYPLSDAARAHRDLESRQTTGSTVMLP